MKNQSYTIVAAEVVLSKCRNVLNSIEERRQARWVKTVQEHCKPYRRFWFGPLVTPLFDETAKTLKDDDSFCNEHVWIFKIYLMDDELDARKIRNLANEARIAGKPVFLTAEDAWALA